MVVPRVGMIIVETMMLLPQSTVITAMMSAAPETVLVSVCVIFSRITVKASMFPMISLMAIRLVGLRRRVEAHQNEQCHSGCGKGFFHEFASCYGRSAAGQLDGINFNRGDMNGEVTDCAAAVHVNAELTGCRKARSGGARLKANASFDRLSSQPAWRKLANNGAQYRHRPRAGIPQRPAIQASLLVA